MTRPLEQLDRRFATLRPLVREAARPGRGWVKAIREALGMTTAQLAARIGVAQPRVAELEKAEAEGKITMRSLERAAEAMGCRLVYVLVPEQPLSDVVRARARALAEQQLASVEQTMRLEAQAVGDKRAHDRALEALTTELLQRPARLWDSP